MNVQTDSPASFTRTADVGSRLPHPQEALIRTADPTRLVEERAATKTAQEGKEEIAGGRVCLRGRIVREESACKHTRYWLAARFFPELTPSPKAPSPVTDIANHSNRKLIGSAGDNIIETTNVIARIAMTCQVYPTISAVPPHPTNQR